MARRIFTTVAIAAVSLTTQVSGQCQQIAGNYYCGATDAITYNNVGFSGTYNQITYMDSSGCQCSSQQASFSGGLAPLNEEISLHLRGPLKISQIAVYHPSSSAKAKREAEPEEQAHGHFAALARHKRGHAHHHDRRGDALVTVTSTAYTTSTRTHSSIAAQNSAVLASLAPSAAKLVGTTWTRDSYYNAATGEQDNIVFLNHLGGTNGSGAWDSCFGNTLSYANMDGVTAAQSSQTLGNVLIPSNKELIAFTAEKCDSGCGYVRPETPAYKGFSTSSETIFLIEFTMPRDSSSGFNVDMSALWFLNAQIPRTLQYGKADCSCWTSGCGEFDIFEILSTGSDFMTTTLHTWQGTGTQYGGGGCSDYISRPLSAPMKAAVIFNPTTKKMNIVVIDSSTTFGAGLTDSDVSSWCSASGSEVNIAG